MVVSNSNSNMNSSVQIVDSTEPNVDTKKFTKSNRKSFKIRIKNIQKCELVRLVKTNFLFIKGKSSVPKYNRRRSDVWEIIASSINRLGPPMQSAALWQKRWNYMRSAVKTKAAIIKNYTDKDDKGCPFKMTYLEWLIWDTFCISSKNNNVNLINKQQNNDLMKKLVANTYTNKSASFSYFNRFYDSKQNTKEHVINSNVAWAGSISSPFKMQPHTSTLTVENKIRRPENLYIALQKSSTTHNSLNAVSFSNLTHTTSESEEFHMNLQHTLYPYVGNPISQESKNNPIALDYSNENDLMQDIQRQLDIISNQSDEILRRITFM